MANNEGIIFADMFINNKEMFVKFFTEIYEENKAEMDIAILNLQGVLNEYQTKSVTEAMAEKFKTSWNEFKTKVLMNQGDLQLLVAYRGAQGKDAEFSQIIKQSDVEGTAETSYGRRYGINAGDDLIKNSMAAIQAAEVQKYLQIHLNGFLNQLESKISLDQARLIHRYHESCLADYLQNTRKHLPGRSWINAFYSSNGGYYYGGQGLGKAYDAFMNHMANKEKSVYDYLASGGLQKMSSFTPKNNYTTVYDEEGGVERTGHFPKLLKDSNNHTGWYTGGDIVIVSPQTMQVVYNIQLKTTTRNNPSVFGEQVQAIRNFINEFIKLSPEQKGEKLFDFFLTSVSNSDDFNTKPQQEIDEMLKDLLSSKLWK